MRYETTRQFQLVKIENGFILNHVDPGHLIPENKGKIGIRHYVKNYDQLKELIAYAIGCHLPVPDNRVDKVEFSITIKIE